MRHYEIVFPIHPDQREDEQPLQSTRPDERLRHHVCHLDQRKRYSHAGQRSLH